MSSNRLYNLFQSSQLNRKDIENYGVMKDAVQKNSIEQKAASNSFDSDAFEGWEENSFNIELMQNIDAKFIQKPKINYLKGISMTLVIGIIISFLFIYNLNHTKEISEKPKVVRELSTSMMIDETDLILPQKIEKMNNAPIHQQIKPKKIILDFAEMKIIDEENQNQTKIDELPIKEIKIEKEKVLITSKTIGKEIYLNDLKLIDYNSIRSHPTVKTKQVLLTGTPANKESEESEEIEATWKTVDIPYNEFMEKSLRILNGGNYKKALSRFETVLKTYSDDLNAYFYSGYCLYNLGEYDTAIDYFQKCMTGKFNNFDEEAEWMSAEAYFLSGNKSKAIKIFKSIVEKNGYYAKQAKAKIS